MLVRELSMTPSSPAPRYTLVFKNGQVLRHQDSLDLAQFRSDGRLAKVLCESLPQEASCVHSQAAPGPTPAHSGWFFLIC